MEELNKNQIILLALLVSFVTSIATGIVTSSLLNVAPPSISQTVNRVVERTIERVVPGEAAVVNVVPEEPVVITEEELIVDLVARAAPALVRIADSAGAFVGTGFLVTDKRWVVTNQLPAPLPPDGQAPGSPPSDPKYQVTLRDGQTFSAGVVPGLAAAGFAALRLDVALNSEVGLALPFLDLAAGEVAAGQTVVALGLDADGLINVARGLVSGVTMTGGEPDAAAGQIRGDAVRAGNLGGPLLNINGVVVGLNWVSGLAIHFDALKKVLDTLL